MNIQKGTLCKLTKTVWGGRPTVSVEEGTPVLVLKQYGKLFYQVYCPKSGVKLSVGQELLELVRQNNES